MIRVDQAGTVRVGRQRSPDKHTGRNATKYVRAANITSEGVDLTDLLEMDFTIAERARFALRVGDVLLTEASGSATQVGRAALWISEIKNCCYQNTVIRFRPHVALPEYAIVAFQHFSASGVFARVARGVGIQHLGAARLAEIAFPLPPLDEQRRIAEVTDRRRAQIPEQYRISERIAS
jgi:Type I restriction modification DNA specificity domain